MEVSCYVCNEWQQHFYWEHLDAKGKKFLRVMTGDFSNGMILPDEFVEQYQVELGEAVDLKVPSGRIWRVQLREAEEKYMFLGDSWKQLVSEYQVEEGDSLLFEYDGLSCFSVSMFNGSGLEKISPYFVKENFLHGKGYQAEEVEDDIDEDTLPRSFFESSSLKALSGRKCHDKACVKNVASALARNEQSLR